MNTVANFWGLLVVLGDTWNAAAKPLQISKICPCQVAWSSPLKLSLCKYCCWEAFYRDTKEETICNFVISDFLPSYLILISVTVCLHLLLFRSLLCTSSHKWDSCPHTPDYERDTVWQSHCDRHQKIIPIQGILQPNHQQPLWDRHSALLGRTNHSKIYVRAPPDCHHTECCPWETKWTHAAYGWPSTRSICNTGPWSCSSYSFLHGWNWLSYNQTQLQRF